MPEGRYVGGEQRMSMSLEAPLTFLVVLNPEQLSETDENLMSDLRAQGYEVILVESWSRLEHPTMWWSRFSKETAAAYSDRRVSIVIGPDANVPMLGGCAV